MMEEGMLEKLHTAKKVLVGIGEEFDRAALLKQQPEYQEIQEYLKAAGRTDLLPLLQNHYLLQDEPLMQALRNLHHALRESDFFVVTTCQSDAFEKAGFPMERVVMPCGSLKMLQCPSCQTLVPIREEEQKEALEKLLQGEIPMLGNCPECQKELYFNNIYVENYNENGYLEKWAEYRKWLQSTINRELVILELGVNLTFPSVIRWPFEKVAFYNQKASFYRVNEKLYQMSEELHEKGISIAKNAIDWLQ